MPASDSPNRTSSFTRILQRVRQIYTPSVVTSDKPHETTSESESDSESDSESTSQIRQLQMTIKERDDTITELKTALYERNGEVDRLEDLLAEYESQKGSSVALEEESQADAKVDSKLFVLREEDEEEVRNEEEEKVKIRTDKGKEQVEEVSTEEAGEEQVGEEQVGDEQTVDEKHFESQSFAEP